MSKVWTLTVRLTVKTMFILAAIVCLGLLPGYIPAELSAAPVVDAGGDRLIQKNKLLGGTIELNGVVSEDTDGTALNYEWYGPFGSLTGSQVSVVIPEGTYTVSLQAVGCPEGSAVDTMEVTTAPGFIITPRSKFGKIQLTWTHLPETLLYEVYRAKEDDPFTFEKIAETTSTYSTYLDQAVQNEKNYLYAVAAINAGNAVLYSNIVASCAPASRATARLNRPPFIYSPAVTVGTLNRVYEYTPLAVDANLDPLTYSLAVAPPEMTIHSGTGKIRWTPAATGRYPVTIHVSDGKGLEYRQSFNIDVTVVSPTVSLAAHPEIVTPGKIDQDRSTLSWCATHADYCIIEPAVGRVNPSGSSEVRPTQTTEYTITAHGPGGTAVDTATVSVKTQTPPPAVDILADPQAISPGGTSRLYWRSTNADTVSIDQGVGAVALNSDHEPGFGKTVSPAIHTTYTITAIGPGGTATDSVTVTVTTLPPTVDISAVPEAIISGDHTRLFWHSTNAHTVQIDQGIGEVALSSRKSDRDITAYPIVTTTYTITATGPGGTATDSVTVTVHAPPPTVDIIAIPEWIPSGGNSWLYWHSANADTVTIDQGIGTVVQNGCHGGDDDGYPGIISGECGPGINVVPQTTTTYTITAVGPGGIATDSVTVTVGVLPPTVEIIAIPESIEAGDESWLYWHSTHADSVTIDQGIGTVAANSCYGSEGSGAGEACGEGRRVTPKATTTYTITATGPGGTATDSVTVTVNVPPPTIHGLAVPNWIRPGDGSRLYWHTHNAEAVTISHGIGNVAVNGCCDTEPEDQWALYLEGCDEGKLVSPRATTTYTFIAVGPGGVAMDSVTVYVDTDPPPAVEITAYPNEIEPGDTSWLNWASNNATQVVIDQGIGVVGLDTCGGYGGYVDPGCSESIVVSPIVTTTYTITASGPGGTATDTVTISVNGDRTPTATFYAESSAIPHGGGTTLHWYSNNAETVTIDQGIGVVPLNSEGGGLTVSPASTTTYTLTATGPGGQGVIRLTVIVLDPLTPLADLIAWPDTVQWGQAATLAWSSANAASVTIAAEPGPDIGDVSPNSGIMGRRVVPETTTTYTITAAGDGGTVTDSVTVKVLPKIEINPSKLPIMPGDPCVLSVQTFNGGTVTIDQGVGPVRMTPTGDYRHTGAVTVNPIEETTYTVSATGNGGTSTAIVKVIVAPKVDFQVDKEIITLGSLAHLHWTTLQAKAVSISPGIGAVAQDSLPSGMAVSPTTTTTYTLRATGATVETSASVKVRVNDFSKPPAVTWFQASPGTIEPGNSAVLRWETANVEQAQIDNGIGIVPLSGSVQVSPQRTTTYTLKVQGPQGATTEQATVRVRGTWALGSFGYRYENTVPAKSTVDLLEHRVALLTGRCEDPNGNPIEAARISILGRPEYGQALTDLQGRYSCPVAGNARYTVVFDKEGKLQAHRDVTVLNNQIAVVDTVTLIEPDSQTTLVSDSVPFHGGRYVEDNCGRRRLSLTLPPGAANVPMEMSTTEYPTSAALPALLPPNTAFAYSAEIGAGQSPAVSFSEPVFAWVDNFLGFAVGRKAPVGWYDRSKGLWIPQENGLVVKLLDSDNNGVVDGLDINGDQQADDLDGDGVYNDEVAGLKPGELQAGMSYIRFPVDRTGPWSLGWPYAPLEAPVPSPTPASYDLESCPAGDCELVQQDIAIPGSGFMLHYSEGRVSAYQPRITIPVTGQSVPAHAEAILVRMTVAGKVYEQHLNPDPNQTIMFRWDGRDHLGQEVTGPVTADIAIGYAYGRNYALAGDFTHAFSQTGAGDSGITGRRPFIAWHQDRLYLNRQTESKDLIADGWTLSAQHQVNLTGPATLHMGDGSTLPRADQWVRKAILDSQCREYGVRLLGGQATGTFGILGGIAVNDAREDIYWSNPSFDVLFRYGINETYVPSPGASTPTPFAGYYYSANDPLPLFSDPLHTLRNPFGVATDGANNLYYADSGNHIIRVTRYGVFAGNRQQGYSGDGGAALAASFNLPEQIASDRWGNIFVVDTGNRVIRRISADGIVETVAGNGFPGSTGDNGPALAAAINPSGIAIDPWGNIYLAEPAFHKVRKIDVSGIITTVAGTGVLGLEGEGGPATAARLSRPVSVAVDGRGACFIGDRERLLEVGTGGVLTRIGPVFNGLGVMTADLEGRLFLNDRSALNVYRMAKPTLADMADGDYFRLSDSSGQQFYFSQTGRHLYTGPPASPTYSFVYDPNDRLHALLDAAGNALVTINRDAAGRATSLETPAGSTTLTVDDHHHLLKVRTPDNDSVTMAYSDPGLLTRFETVFTGHILGAVTDSAGGAPLGDVTVTLVTDGESQSVRTQADGQYSFTGLKAEAYTLEFKKAGFFSQAITGKILFGRSRITHNAAMLSHPILQLRIDTPQNNAVVSSPVVPVTGQVSAGSRVTVNGSAAATAGNHFTAEVTLSGEGEHRITVIAVDNYGGQKVAEVGVTYACLPVVSLSVTPGTIRRGERAELIWSAENTTACAIDNGIGPVDKNGSLFTTPGQTTTYTITATGPGGTITQSVTVSVLPLPAVAHFNVSPDTLSPGAASTLSWAVSNADAVTIDNGIGVVANEGSVTVRPGKTATYTLRATGPGGTSTATATITVDHPQPTIRFSAAPEVILTGQSTTLTWTTTHATEVTISHIGAVGTNGSRSVSPDRMRTYTLTATGPGGAAAATAKVFVYKGNQYDYGDPTPAEQAHLEAINRSRLNPGEEAVRLGIDLNEGLPPGTISPNPVPPLVFNARLLQAAQLHSEDMMARQYYAHNSLDGRTPADRIREAGYAYGHTGENLSLAADSSPLDETETVLKAHDALFIDAGVTGRSHRRNILDGRFKEIGIGVSGGVYLDYPYAYMTTCNLGASSWEKKSFLLGVVYDDGNRDGIYTAGEGIGEVTITIHGAGYETLTAGAGGFGIPLPPGTYQVIATLPNGAGAVKEIFILDQNVKLDFLLSEFTAPPVVAFSPDRTILTIGGTTLLSWSVINANSVSIDNGVGEVQPLDSISVSPKNTTTYTMTAVGQGGVIVHAVTIYVIDPSAVPVAEINADPITVLAGTSAALSWHVTNADAVSIDNGIGMVEPSGRLAVTPTATTTYHLTGSGPGGLDTASVTLGVTYPRPTASFSAAPVIITAGESTTLTWHTTGAETVTLAPGIGAVGRTGSMSVTPAQTTTYTLTATGPGGTTTATGQVQVVHPKPGVLFTTASKTIIAGESVSLSWNITGADTIRIDNGIGAVGSTGSTTVTPAATTTYTLTATGPGGTAAGSITVTVTEPGAPPVIAFSASPEVMQSGKSSTLSWNVVNATTFGIDKGIGAIGANGSASVSPAQTTTYTLTATGPGGTTTRSVTVRVSAIGITISSPAPGQVIPRPDVMVKGTFTNPAGAETGILVNGVLACVSGNQFVANHVPLQKGENTLTVTATDTTGDTNTANVSLSAEWPEHYIRLLALPESGTAPFETTLRVDGMFGFTANPPSHTGPGTVEFLESSEENEFKVRLSTEGVYYFTANTIHEGVTYTDTVAVTVVNRSLLDALLKNKWNAMKAALISGDIETAVSYYRPASQDQYRAIYTALGGELTRLGQEMQEISPIYFDDILAKYRIRQNHMIEGQNITITYYIYFRVGMDGIWRIEQF